MDVDYSVGSPGHHAGGGGSSVIVSTEQAAAKQLHYQSAVNQQQTNTCKLAAMSQFLINRAAAASNSEKLSSSEDFSERHRRVNQGSDRKGDEEESERRDDHEESESIDDRFPNAGLKDSHEESREEESVDTGDTNQEISSAKGEVSLKSECNVCGSPAAAHLHYGAVSCYSCRAFFRRGKPRQMRCIFGNNECKITKYNRTNCKFCRYTKCIKGGMIPEKVDATLKKKQERLAAQAALETASAAIGDNNLESDNNGDGNRESAGPGSSGVQGNTNRKSAVHGNKNKGTAARDRESIINKTGLESNLSANKYNKSPERLPANNISSQKMKDMELKSSSSIDFCTEKANIDTERKMPSKIRCKDMNALNNRDIKIEDAPNFNNVINALTGMKMPPNNNVLNSRVQEQIKKEGQTKSTPEIQKYASVPMDVDSNEGNDTKDIFKMAFQQSAVSPAMLRNDFYSSTGRIAGSTNIGPDSVRNLWTQNQLLAGSSHDPGNSPKNRQLTELELYKDGLDMETGDAVGHNKSSNNTRHDFMPPGGAREREVPSMRPQKDAQEDVRNQHLNFRDGRKYNGMEQRVEPMDERELSEPTRNEREDSLLTRNVRDHSVDMRDSMESRRSQLEQGYDLSSSNKTLACPQQSKKPQVDKSFPSISLNTPTNLSQVRAGQNLIPVIQEPAQNPLNFSQKFDEFRPGVRFPRPHVNNQFSLLPSQSSSSSKYQDVRGFFPGPSGIQHNPLFYNNYNSAGDQKSGGLFPGPIVAHSSNTYIRNTGVPANHTSVIQRRAGYKDRNLVSQEAEQTPSNRLTQTNIKQKSSFNGSHEIVNRPCDLEVMNNRQRVDQSPERIFPHHWSNFMPGRSMFHPHLDPVPFSIRPPLSAYRGQEDRHCNMPLFGEYGNPQMNPRMQNYLSHNNMHPQMRVPGQHFDLHQQLMDDARARNLEPRKRERFDKDISDTSTMLDELGRVSYDPTTSSAYNLAGNANHQLNRQIVSQQDAPVFPLGGSQELVQDRQTAVPEFEFDGSLLSSLQQSSQLRNFEGMMCSSNQDADFESFASNNGSQVVPDYLPDLSDLETLLSESITDPSDMSVISNSLRPDPMLDFEIESMFSGDTKKRTFDDVLEETKLLVADETPPPKRPLFDNVGGFSMPLKKRRRMYQLEYPIEHGINRKSLPLLAFTSEEELQLINYIDRIEEYQNKRVEFLLRNYKCYRELLISYVNCTKLDSKVPFSKKNESTICILGLEFTKANAAKMFNEFGNLGTDVRRRLLHSTYPALYVIFFSILEGNTKSSTWIEQQEKTLYITSKTHSLIMHDYNGLTNVRSISIKDQERFTSPWAQSRADEDKFDYTISLVGRLVGQDKRLQALFHMLVMLTPDVTDTPIRIQDDGTLLRMQVIITRLLYRYLCYRHTSGMDDVKEEKQDPQEKSNESSVMKLTADLPKLNPADKTRMFIHLIEEVHDCAKIMRKRSLPGQI